MFSQILYLGVLFLQETLKGSLFLLLSPRVESTTLILVVDNLA